MSSPAALDFRLNYPSNVRSSLEFDGRAVSLNNRVYN